MPAPAVERRRVSHTLSMLNSLSVFHHVNFTVLQQSTGMSWRSSDRNADVAEAATTKKGKLEGRHVVSMDEAANITDGSVYECESYVRATLFMQSNKCFPLRTFPAVTTASSEAAAAAAVGETSMTSGQRTNYHRS